MTPFDSPAQRRRRRRQRRTLLLVFVLFLLLAGIAVWRESTLAPVVADTPTRAEVEAAATTLGAPGDRPGSAAVATNPTTTMKLVPVAPPTQVAKGLDVYRGLGVWVDLYDVGPGAAVQPSSVPDMAARGVRTMYLQAGRASQLAPTEVIGPLLAAAHQHNIAVVAWYLPEFGNIDLDVLRVEQMHTFEYQGHRFDGLSIDIEDTATVVDHATRNGRLIEFSKRLRTKLPADYPLAACVIPPAQLEVVSPNYWPNFPYREIDPYYQVWQPMGYWTDMTIRSGYRHDAYSFTKDSVDFVRTKLGRADVLVHPIGGQAAKTTLNDIREYRRAVQDTRSIGVSLYDYASTPRQHWEVLKDLPEAADPNGPPLPPRPKPAPAP